MKPLTFASVAAIVGISSVLSLTLSANAESRYEYCQHHDCNESHSDHDHDRFFDRYHDRYADRHICESHHRSCWFDRTAGAWRFRD